MLFKSANARKKKQADNIGKLEKKERSDTLR